MASSSHDGSRRFAAMNIVVFGLTVSSSWGNGHATLWRGLIRALGTRGHRVVFFERNVPYYAAHRDLSQLDGHALYLYDDWETAAHIAKDELSNAHGAFVTSYGMRMGATSEKGRGFVQSGAFGPTSRKSY